MDETNYDAEDVAAALARTDTADGSGFQSETELPPSDIEEEVTS